MMPTVSRLLARVLRGSLDVEGGDISPLQMQKWDNENRFARKANRIAAYAALLSTVASIATVGALYAALDQAGVARRSLLDTNRAWIKINLISGIFEVERGVLTIQATTHAENVGNKPATNLTSSISPIPWSSKAMDNYALVVKDTCNDAKLEAKATGLGVSVFQNDSVDLTGGAIATPDMLAYSAQGGPSKKYWITVVACATYNIPGDSEEHMVGQLYYINPPGGHMPAQKDANAEVKFPISFGIVSGGTVVD